MSASRKFEVTSIETDEDGNLEEASQIIEAVSFRVSDGILIFDSNEFAVAAFNVDSWASVTEYKEPLT